MHHGSTSSAARNSSLPFPAYDHSPLHGPANRHLSPRSAALVVLTGPLAAQSTADAISLLNDVRYLSDDKLEGG